MHVTLFSSELGCSFLQALIAQGRDQEVIGATHAAALKAYHKQQSSQKSKAVTQDSAGKYQHMQQPVVAPVQVQQHTLPAVYLVPVMPSIGVTTGLHQPLPTVQTAFQQPDLPQPQQGAQRDRKAALQTYQAKKTKRALQGTANTHPTKKVGSWAVANVWCPCTRRHAFPSC